MLTGLHPPLLLQGAADPANANRGWTGIEHGDIRFDEDYARFYEAYSGQRKLPPPVEGRTLYSELGLLHQKQQMLAQQSNMLGSATPPPNQALLMAGGLTPGGEQQQQQQQQQLPQQQPQQQQLQDGPTLSTGIVLKVLCSMEACHIVRRMPNIADRRNRCRPRRCRRSGNHPGAGTQQQLGAGVPAAE